MLPNSLKRNQLPFFPYALIIIALFMVTLLSCNGKGAKEPTCVKLTRAQLQKWADKGFIKYGQVNIIRLKVAYAWPGSAYKVYAVVQTAENGSMINESLIELKPLDSCLKDHKGHIKLDDYASSGTIPANLEDWDIWKKDGSKKINDSLDYIQLEPYDYPYRELRLMALHDYKVKKGGIRTPVLHPMINKVDGLLPCPPCPNCKQPCPPPSSCTAPCEIKIDSTIDRSIITDTTNGH